MKKTKKIKIVALVLVICALFVGVRGVFNKPNAISRYVYTRSFATAANPAFEDENFYACIIDEYNYAFDTDLGYNYKLSDENLANITYLYCDYKIKSVSGIEKLSNLRTLSLYDSDPTLSVNVSKNSKLLNLTVFSPVKEIVPGENLDSLHLGVYENTYYNLSNFTALNTLTLSAVNELSQIPWSMLGTISDKEFGLSLYDFAGELSLDFSNLSHLERLTLDGLNITSLNMPESVVSLSVNNEVTLRQGFLGNKIYDNIKYIYIYNMQLNNFDFNKFTKVHTLQFNQTNLTNLQFSLFPDLENLYIGQCGINNIDLSSNVNLEHLHIENNDITSIDLSNNTELYSLDLQNNKLTNLDVSKNLKLTSLDVSHNNLTKLDVSKNPKLSSLYLQGNPWQKEFFIYKDTTIDLFNDVEFVKYYKYNDPKYLSGDLKTTAGEWKKDKDKYYYSWIPKADSKYALSVSNESVEINDKTVKFTKSGDYTVNANYVTNYSSTYSLNDATYTGTYKVHVIELTSDRYIIDYENNWIFVGSDDENVIKSNVEALGGDIKIENNKLQVLYNDVILKEFTLYTISFGDLDAGNGYILIDEAVSYDEIVKNIQSSEGITYKIFDGEQEITSGDIELGAVLKIYKDSTEIATYKFTNEFIDMSQFKTDETNKIIYDLQLGSTIADLKNKISTSGEIKVVNSKGEALTDDKLIATGAKVSIKLSSETLEYTLSVLGDCTGDGVIKINDITKAYQGFKNKISLSAYDFKAVDVSKEGALKINDITKLYQFFKGKISNL